MKIPEDWSADWEMAMVSGWGAMLLGAGFLVAGLVFGVDYCRFIGGILLVTSSIVIYFWRGSAAYREHERQRRERRLADDGTELLGAGE